MTTSIAVFKGEYKGGKVEVTIKCSHDHYPTWCEMTKVFYESPIAFNLERKQE